MSTTRGGRWTTCAIVLLLAGLWPAVSLQADTPRATLTGEFHEAVQEEVSVSGSVVVGVAAAGALSGPATLSGLIIPSSSPLICLTVLSQDGVYFARNTYQVPEQAQSDAAAFVLLPFEGTKRRDLISSFGPGEMSVRATPGDCAVASDTYLVASDATAFATVDILINAFGATDVYYRTGDDSEGECAEFVEGRRTSYDYRCQIPVSAMTMTRGRHSVFIERERYGRLLGEVEIELDFGPEP
jgi:hypothetical protein